MTLVIYNERHIAPPRQIAAAPCEHAALTLQEHSLLWNNCYPKEPSGSHWDKLVAKYCSWQQVISRSGCYTKYNKQITLWLPVSVADETPNIKENHLCWKRRLNKIKNTLQVKRVLFVKARFWLTFHALHSWRFLRWEQPSCIWVKTEAEESPVLSPHSWFKQCSYAAAV